MHERCLSPPVLVVPQVRERGGRRVQHLVTLVANAPCAMGQNTPECRAVTRQPGGTAGIRSVNVFRGHAAFPHFRRRFTQRSSTGSSLRRTSRGQATASLCTRDNSVPHSVPHSGQYADPGRSVTARTSTMSPGPVPASVTRSPATPNNADAAS